MTFQKQTPSFFGKQACPSWLILALLAMALTVLLSGCSSPVDTPKATASGPQVYMTPTINGGVGNTSLLGTFSIDDTALSFSLETHSAQSVAQVNYSGDLASPNLARGLEELELAYACGTISSGTCPGIAYTPSANNPSGWAVELAGQSGGLAQLTGNSVTPLVPAVACPSMSSAETFLFVTLPDLLITTGTTGNGWNPTSETAYGSVDISASGSTVTFAGIKQSTLNGGTPSNSSSASVTGTCSSTAYGNTVAVPANSTITVDPTGTVTITPQAMLGIGPSGLLVEDSGGTGYLGAGTGAIGLPKPSSQLDTSSGSSSLLSAQYLGFFYGSGYEAPNSTTPTYQGFSSVASFGFSSTLQSACAAVVAAGTSANASTTLEGGDFTNNNPRAGAVQSNGGFGNCDFAIDLGPQDASTNGLFTKANVWVGPGTTTNTTGKWYSFPAVAVASQLNGKYAIFLIGEDTVGSPSQAWGIYLLQSN